jgi:hypothetical protein
MFQDSRTFNKLLMLLFYNIKAKKSNIFMYIFLFLMKFIIIVYNFIYIFLILHLFNQLF